MRWGTVWSNTDELLHRPVAVKELKLSPELPADDAAELQERRFAKHARGPCWRNPTSHRRRADDIAFLNWFRFHR